MLTPLRAPRVYSIADCDTLGEEGVPAAVEAMAQSGVEWIQIRAKRLPDRAFYHLVEECLGRLRGSRAKLWIDDRADLAALLPVAGVHVGQQDLPPSATRRVVGRDCWIGHSTHDGSQLAAADRDPDVDVVALGPIFPTGSKQNPDPVVGLEGLREARRSTAKPLVAIGGIDAERVGEVLAAGADAVAVIGAACRGDVRARCERLLAAAKEVR